MDTDKHRHRDLRRHKERLINIFSLSVSISVYLWLILFSSCASKPTDLRTLAPAETLIYLETDDLAAVLKPIVDSKPFTEIATKKPDFSALKGVQLAVAVTGFETSEVELTDEQSLGRIRPRFVAIADTHAWNFQAVGFAEQKLASFVADIYDGEPKLEKADKHGGKYFTWTAKDGRKAFALVIDSLIYFGNDETAIEKALAVRRGDADHLAKSGKLPPRVPGSLASGYVSTDGVAQIANIAGLQFASQASDDPEIQSAVAGILPQIIRGTITDISWSASQTNQGIEDKWQIGMPAEMATVFNETMAAGDAKADALMVRVPDNSDPVTVYNFSDPQVAWRSVLLASQKLTDPLAGKMIGEFSSAFFEPYGIRDPELFLSSVGSPIAVTRTDDDADNVAAIAAVKSDAVRSAFLPDIKRDNSSQEFERWQSEDGDIAAAFKDGLVIVGNSDNVAKIVARPVGERRASQNTPSACVVTDGSDRSSTLPVVEFLAREGHGDTVAKARYRTETRFTKTGMERRTVSDLGFVGWLIAQLAAE